MLTIGWLQRQLSHISAFDKPEKNMREKLSELAMVKQSNITGGAY